MLLFAGMATLHAAAVIPWTVSADDALPVRRGYLIRGSAPPSFFWELRRIHHDLWTHDGPRSRTKAGAGAEQGPGRGRGRAGAMLYETTEIVAIYIYIYTYYIYICI